MQFRRDGPRLVGPDAPDPAEAGLGAGWTQEEWRQKLDVDARVWPGFLSEPRRP